MKPLLPAAAFLLSGTAAMAQLAPQDILDNWRGFYAGFGASIVTAPPEVSGSSTRYANVLTQMDMAGTETRYYFEWINMERRPDGALDITFSPNGYASSFAEISGEPVESRVSYDLGALTIRAEGAPGDIRYSYAAPIITLSQSQSLPDIEISMIFALENISGNVRAQRGAGGSVSEVGTLGAQSLTAKISLVPQAGFPAYLSYSSENPGADYSIAMDARPLPESPQAFTGFPEDMLFGLTLTTGPATTTLDQPGAGGSRRFTFTQSGGELGAAYADNTLRYGLTATGATIGLASTPPRAADFSAAFASAYFGLTLPIQKSETPSPFALALKLDALTFEDDFWARLDPERALTRSPASFAFAINGTLRLLVDLFDPQALSALQGPPFELRTLSLTNLGIDIEGMALSGSGDLSFNNGQTDPVSGLPAPEGVLDFSVFGALTALDRIGRLGLLDPMIIIGAKGALGMFATPGASPDTFSTRIEFTEGGGVTVNGQPLK